MKDVRLTHVGGPTLLLEVGGWRLLTVPTFDPPGDRYSFGWGSSSCIERELANAPKDIRRRFRWLPNGTAVDLGA